MRDGGGRVGLHQVLDVGERVEEEVRLDLRLHERQARLEDVLLELVALRLGLEDARRVAGVALAQQHGGHHHAAHADAQAHRDGHAGQALVEHRAQVRGP